MSFNCSSSITCLLLIEFLNKEKNAINIYPQEINVTRGLTLTQNYYIFTHGDYKVNLISISIIV